ncbi:hypothetical protein ACHAW6_004773 [Cyclotella cf. meneghiniana]
MGAKSRMSTPTLTVYETPFSPTRQSGNKYIMVMVEIDSSTKLVEPLKNRTDVELTCTYST